jgi:tRNA-modifying protein YgfZ
MSEISAPTLLLPLTGLGLIRLQGPEARAFLQSQLTNDANAVSAEQAQLSGYCSPKGRLLALGTVLMLDASGEQFGLTLAQSTLPATLKRLRMFVLRSKLTLDDASADWSALGLMGPKAAQALAQLDLAAPATDWGTTLADGLLVLRRPGPVPRYELRGTPQRLADCAARLQLPVGQRNDWDLQDIAAGLPEVAAETVDQWVPQAVALDRLGGVSFTKGCYPGQEIVARVHYLGRVKQGLFRASVSADTAHAGTRVLAGQGDGAAGQVVRAARRSDGTWMLLLSLNLDATDRHLRLDEAGEAALDDITAINF